MVNNNKIIWGISLLLLISSCSTGKEIPPTNTSDPSSNLYIPTQTSQPDPIQASPPEPLPTGIPTAVPINDSEYQGWWTYTNPTFGFSLKLPVDWVVNQTSYAALDGYTLNIQPRDAGSHIPDRF